MRAPQSHHKVPLIELALPFCKIGLTSFGGGLSAWVYREFVTMRSWITEDEFLGALTISQILPGPNIVNLAMNIGYVLRGTIGSLVSVLSLMIPPIVVIILMSVGFAQVDQYPWIHEFMEGVAAAAMGMTASVAIRNIRNSTKFGYWPIGISALVVSGIFIMKWPIVPVVLMVSIIGFLIAKNQHKRAAIINEDGQVK